MISTKDLAYLSDIFEWNFTAGKVANHYKEEVDNEEIKDNESRQRRDEMLAEEAAIKQAQEEKDDQLFGGGKDE